LRAFDSDDAGTQQVMATAPLLLDFLNEDDGTHFNEVKALLDAADVPYVIDATLVRGLDYYARTVFEFTNSLMTRSLCSSGVQSSAEEKEESAPRRPRSSHTSNFGRQYGLFPTPI